MNQEHRFKFPLFPSTVLEEGLIAHLSTYSKPEEVRHLACSGKVMMELVNELKQPPKGLILNDEIALAAALEGKKKFVFRVTDRPENSPVLGSILTELKSISDDKADRRYVALRNYLLCGYYFMTILNEQTPWSNCFGSIEALPVQTVSPTGLTTQNRNANLEKSRKAASNLGMV